MTRVEPVSTATSGEIKAEALLLVGEEISKDGEDLVHTLDGKAQVDGERNGIHLA